MKMIIMTMNDKISDYITFPRNFENYGWYKAILVFIVAFIITLILTGLTLGVTYLLLGFDFIKTLFVGGYNALNSPLTIFVSDLCIIVFIPSLYLASKIVKDRPFSSYSSSRGGWNFKLYFKALLIPLILYLIYIAIDTAISGPKGTPNLSIEFLLVLLISVPLQSIAEEYVFRGLFMQTFGSWFKIPLLAIAIQAILFAIIHGYNSIGLFEMLCCGLGYGFFAWKTNGIEVSSALHSVNNFTVGLSIMLGLKTSTSSPQLLDVVGIIVFEIIMFIILYYVGKRTDWFGEIPENSQNT